MKATGRQAFGLCGKGEISPKKMSVTRRVSPPRVTLLYVGSSKATSPPRSITRVCTVCVVLKPQDEIFSKGPPKRVAPTTPG